MRHDTPFFHPPRSATFPTLFTGWPNGALAWVVPPTYPPSLAAERDTPENGFITENTEDTEFSRRIGSWYVGFVKRTDPQMAQMTQMKS